MKNNPSNLKLARNIGVLAISALILTGSSALANMSKPDTDAKSQNTPTATKAREILDRASFVAFEAAAALQKEQVSVSREETAEQLKNYMAAMIYEPKSVLPSDADVLDEPWMASTSGLSDEDGMVTPHLEDRPALKNLKITSPISAKPFLKLLQPVQNALVTSPFGFRWGRPHQGIDLAAPVGTPIRSAEAGKVVYSGWKQGYGNFVAIDHGHGFQTHYAHCSKLLVRIGQTVNKGEQIAKVGNTGHSTGPHLHFEVMANGVHRNPAKFLNQTTVVVQAQ
ncbi:M23 family metallopeptidase [Vampirovibrio chlorellavorus]|uniref:M23 family metallopeptidase n=1 Tax=Vampirovibrio chlorellavorus TaxID=758823 RepID=UPI0026EF686F|nr:M23 family metallopeptidase [Vampirovibrio chlorellavorus]